MCILQSVSSMKNQIRILVLKNRHQNLLFYLHFIAGKFPTWWWTISTLSLDGQSSIFDIYICHTAIENLSDSIGYLLDFTNPYYTALAGNMKARAKKDNSFWNHT